MLKLDIQLFAVPFRKQVKHVKECAVLTTKLVKMEQQLVLNVRSNKTT